MMSPTRTFLTCFCLWMGALAAPPTSADIRVEVDRESLDTLLAEVTAQEVPVALPTGSSMNVRVRDLKILELTPGIGEEGALRVQVTVVAPDLKLELPLTPRLRFSLGEGGTEMIVRFEDVALDLGLTRLDLASAIPPLLYPAEFLFQLEGAAEPVPIRVRLAEVAVTETGLRFRMGVEPGAPAAAEVR